MVTIRHLTERLRSLTQPPGRVRPPLNIGHRGASGDAPENTFAAFELALRQGADGFEFDVHLSADGVPVVIHDPRLERTTPDRGWVRERRASALRRLDAGSWFNRRFPSKARPGYSGQKIPLLSEVLAWVRQRQCPAFLEIKDSEGAYAGIEEKVLETIEAAGVVSNLTVISFDLATLERLRQLDPRISLGIDFTRPQRAIWRAGRVKAEALLPHWAFASPRFIQRAHRRGFRVLTWNLNQKLWMRQRILDGVDGIITNFPERLAEVRARLWEGAPL